MLLAAPSVTFNDLRVCSREEAPGTFAEVTAVISFFSRLLRDVRDFPVAITSPSYLDDRTFFLPLFSREMDLNECVAHFCFIVSEGKTDSSFDFLLLFQQACSALSRRNCFFDRFLRKI